MAESDLAYLLERVDVVPWETGDHLFFFSTRNKTHYNYLYVFYAHVLAKHDIPSLFLYRHDKIGSVFPNLRVNEVPLSNCLEERNLFLHYPGEPDELAYNWEYDPPGESIQPEALDGEVNLFPALLATLRKHNQRYNINFETGSNRERARDFLHTADLVLHYCRLMNEVAGEHDKKIRIVGYDTSYVPNNLFYLFSRVDSIGSRIEYIELGTQYNSYFQGTFKNFGNAIGGANYTRRGITNTFLGHEREFQDFVTGVQSGKPAEGEVEEEVVNDLEGNILPGRLSDENRADPEERKQFKRRLDREKKAGNNRYCLFGHVFFDVGLHDSSRAFSDMCDWMDETVEFFEGRDDYLVLKPHPSEFARSDPQQLPNETLRSYLGERVRDVENIELIKPNLCEANELYQHLTCGLVWKSSVGMEMTYAGVPTIVSGPAYYTPYVDLPTPSSREEYRDLLSQNDYSPPGGQLRRNVILFLYFMKHHLHVEFPYLRGVDYTKPANMEEGLRWDGEALARYLREGDPPVEELLLDEL